VVDLRRAPVGSDNRPFFAPNIFPSGYLTQFVGVSDDVAAGVVGGGELITLTTDAVEVATVEIQFIHKFYLAGGAAVWDGAVLGDWVRFTLHAVGTAGTSNEGAGVYDKYPLGGGANMYIPNATQTGDWDLDLAEKLNANVDFTKVVPVPATGNTGFFDWDMDTGIVTLNVGQTGRYNLFDFEVTLHSFVNKVPLIGRSAQLFTVPAIKPYLCLPQWHVCLSINNSTEKTLELGVMIYRGIL